MENAITKTAEREDLRKLLALAAKGENKAFAGMFLEIMDKYGLWDKRIVNVNRHVDGSTALEALIGTDLNDIGRHKNPFLVKCKTDKPRPSAKYYREPFGPYSDRGSYWVRGDFKIFFASELKKLDLKLARIKIFITEPLGIPGFEVDNIYAEIERTMSER